MAEDKPDAKEQDAPVGIKVYMSGNSGNKEIVTAQQRIIMILSSMKIKFIPIDIAAPGMEDDTNFMRAHAKKKEGQRHVLPPQLFNCEKYCGDFEDFDLANEDDVLEEFLGIPRKNPKPEPVATDAVPAEAAKLEVGKLPADTAAPENTNDTSEVPMETDKLASQELEQAAKEE